MRELSINIDKTSPKPLLISFGAALFFGTSGLGAFLLFLVQPLIGKTLLPLYGGSASVWTTCLLFFQTVLLAGYGYAHLLTTLAPPRKQVWMHGVTLGMAVAFSSILPDTPKDVSTHVPIAMLLWTLIRHVGIPFFALSTTAPLLQHWFHVRFSSRSPYPLYAISNAGSLFAVLVYPFLVERFFPLNTQELMWSIGFSIFAVSCMASGWFAAAVRKGTADTYGANQPSTSHDSKPFKNRDTASDSTAIENSHNRGRCVLWFGFSTAGSVLLLTTTEQISQDVAATPLFWMIPLCLYLLSYVVSFSRDGAYKRTFWLPTLVFATTVVAAQVFFGNRMPIILQLTLYVFTLFTGCMVAHGELAQQKPDASRLTQFYLWTSFGGISGGILVAIVAPMVFPDLWEYSLAWPALLLLLWHTISKESSSLESELRARKIKIVVAAGVVVSGIGFIVDVVHDNLSTVYSSRNFYGRLTISETKKTRCLYHGRTLHGCQPKKTNILKPAFYYAPESGMGMAQQIYRDLSDKPVRTGVVGLGAGISSVWNGANDTMLFYEIDPDVISVAQKEFDYLQKAKGTIGIVAGDARLTLAAENRQNAPQLDILVMDAFSSDAIPLHLLTTEAIEIYRKRVRPGGVFVFHISNRHLNLEPIMLGVAGQLSAEAFIVYTETDYDRYILDTTWVIITGNKKFIEQFQKTDSYYDWPTQYSQPLVFTDQYSNILDLI
ncbi:MAG: fused MFS/spermidine synthase [Deltaproteobacteria bacterium]|nr:fused MFS/spermidine synthase [Deltaproteobacteria bacterium]